MLVTTSCYDKVALIALCLLAGLAHGTSNRLRRRLLLTNVRLKSLGNHKFTAGIDDDATVADLRKVIDSTATAEFLDGKVAFKLIRKGTVFKDTDKISSLNIGPNDVIICLTKKNRVKKSKKNPKNSPPKPQVTAVESPAEEQKQDAPVIPPSQPEPAPVMPVVHEPSQVEQPNPQLQQIQDFNILEDHLDANPAAEAQLRNLAVQPGQGFLDFMFNPAVQGLVAQLMMQQFPEMAGQQPPQDLSVNPPAQNLPQHEHVPAVPDGGAQMVGQQWPCTVCTFLNQPDQPICTVCAVGTKLASALAFLENLN